MIRVAIIGVGILATIMALQIQSIYALWYLCSDLIYAILFPQLFCVIYIKDVNTYGALLGYIVGVILRVGGGEKVINLDPFIKYPYYDEVENTQLFPFRTFAMLCSFVTIISVSYAMKFFFAFERIPKKLDVLKCFHEEYEHAFRPIELSAKDGVKLVEVTKI